MYWIVRSFSVMLMFLGVSYSLQTALRHYQTNNSNSTLSGELPCTSRNESTEYVKIDDADGKHTSGVLVAVEEGLDSVGSLYDFESNE